MRSELLTYAAFLTRSKRWRWMGLIPLAVLAAVVEAVGAAAVFWLIKILEEPSRVTELPGISILFDALPWHDHRGILVIAILLMAAFYLFKNSLLAAEAFVRSKVVSTANAELSQRMLRGYLSAPYAVSGQRNSAELIRNVKDAVDIAYTAVTSGITLISHTLLAAGILSVLIATAPVVTLSAGIVLAGLLAVMLKLTQHIFGRWGRRVFYLHQEILQSLQQALGSLKELKVLGRERHFFETFAQRQDAFVRIQYLHATFSVVPRLVIEAIFVCGGLLAIILVLLRGSIGLGSIPLLGLYAYAGFRLLPLANGMLWHLNELRYGLPSIRQLYAEYTALMSDAGDDFGRPHGKRMPFSDQLVLERVSYTYKGSATAALQEVSLSIRQGESIGIVGPTGAGKSTLADLIIGVRRPTSGRILIDGADLFEQRNSWYGNIGYVPQSIFLIDDSLRRNIALGIADDAIDEAKLRAAVRCARLEELVASLTDGLDALAGERGVRLSGGEMQRVGIARALYHEPDVLVFDEATASLDVQTEDAVLRAVETLPSVQTRFVITHRLSTVRRCDRIVFLQNGRLSGFGTFDELLEQNADFRAMTLATESNEAVA